MPFKHYDSPYEFAACFQSKYSTRWRRVDDDFYPVAVLWMRSADSMNSELDRALTLFLSFICAVCVFDLVFAVAELMLLAGP
eukprot:gene24573-32537_t